MSALKLSNRTARRLWLQTHGLANTPTGPFDLSEIVANLGFVQLDSIRHIERAHDHIVWSRNQNYRVGGLDNLLKNRGIFEHFTHDASVLPMTFLPMWRRQFQRKAEWIAKAGWWKRMPDAEGRELIKARIMREGALCTKDFDSEGPRPTEMWHRPAHKLGLDYMWYAGELATCHREKFVKYYDLAERVFPASLWGQEESEAAQINWLCTEALRRLGFATVGEIQRFWDACSNAEVRIWLEQNKALLVPVVIETANGATTQAWALSGIEDRISKLEEATTRLRVINPFDPAFRDRKRTEQLFDFSYRNEIFVPAAKRQYGYYVYPILEGARLVGRVSLKADRDVGALMLEQLWPEAGVAWPSSRQAKLESELVRFARFSDLTFERGSSEQGRN